MQKNKPLVSVLMTAYNAEDYIESAIQSILDQTYKNFEFIIVEDCSKDNTWKIIEKFSKKDKRVKTVKNKKNLKAGESSNKAIPLCKGKYIIRMDADDWSYPDRIEKQVKYMEKNPKIVVSGSAMIVCDENLKTVGTRYYPQTDREIRSSLLRLNQIPHPASIWKSEALSKTSLYQGYQGSADYGLVLDISQYGLLGNINEPLIKFRVHSKSMSNSAMALQQKATLFFSNKAVREYGYKRSMKDRLWNWILIISMYTVPSKIKRCLLNKMVVKK